MTPFPSNRQWRTDHSSDIFGHIVRSKNLDFNRDGYLSLARKGQVLYSEDDDSNFEEPRVIVSDDSKFYIITDGNQFSIDDNDSCTVTQLATSSMPNTSSLSDAVPFNGGLAVTGNTTLHSYSISGDSWNSEQTSLGNAGPHALCVQESTVELAVAKGTAGNEVGLYNTSYTLQTTLTLPTEYIIQWIRYRENNLYIGTRHAYGGEAKLFIWNGSGTQYQYAFGCGADIMYSACEYRGSLAVITSSGQLRRFNGGSWEELAQLPVYFTPYSWSTTTPPKVAPRGMTAVGDIIYLNIDGSVNLNNNEGPGSYLYNQPSGLWVFDPRIGLYHKAGYNYVTKKSVTPSSIQSNFVVLPAAHGLSTGDPVLASVVAGITGLTAGRIYYAIVDGTATFKLALSPADALAGRHITISGTPTSDKVTYESYASMGGSYIRQAGPVHPIGVARPNLFYGSEVLYAGSANDETMSQISVVMSLGLGRNHGSFITAKIPSVAALDTFNKLISDYTPLRTDEDKLIIKYRTSERFGLPTPYSQLTWTSATTFTVDTTVYDFKNVEVGDEIEITGGAGAGYTAHITAINTDSTTYAVTIDETLPVSSTQTASFFVDNWTKLTPITNDSEDNVHGLAELGLDGDDTKSKWVQFKVELRGFGIAIEGMNAVSSPAELRN